MQPTQSCALALSVLLSSAASLSAQLPARDSLVRSDSVGARRPPAEASNPEAVRAAIARLDFMVGRWRGEAWQLRGGERVGTQMQETVERKLDGTVLLVEGRGTMPVSGAEDRVVHHALGVITYDPQSGRYTLRSHLATGQWGDFVVTPIENGVSWTRQVPGGTVRNTARFTPDEWVEVGEFSRDGTTWTQIMELRLRREQ